MKIRFEEVGQRLKAYRLGKGLSADEIAEHIGVSRAAVYRLEKGEIVKIQALEALSVLLEVSLPSLLGVSVEYYTNSVSFFERMRQLEDSSTHLLGNFSPISSLILSSRYMEYLRPMLLESMQDTEDPEDAQTLIDKVLSILEERRAAVARKRVPLVSIVGGQELERMLHLGLIGRFGLPEAVRRERREAARLEVEHIRDLIRRQPIGIQIGVLEGQPAAQTFQIYEHKDHSAVTLSPYRLGDQPNISSGIALATSVQEAVKAFQDTFARQWERAKKGMEGADILQRMLDRTLEEGEDAARR